MDIVKRPHAAALCRFARARPEVMVLSADLTSSSEADDLRAALPAQFLSLGMAEQNMIGFAAGLAREGLVPYVHTFAVFLTRRVFDQVAMAVAYPNLPVRLIGFLPGVTTPGGVTHQAIDDLALMRTLPNMTVLECADATDVEGVLDAAHAVDGPVYVRMLRGEVPRLFPAGEPFPIGRVRLLRRGTDVLVIASGISVEEALRASAALAARGVSVGLLSVSTIKPFDDPLILDAAQAARLGVVTLENHSVVGGLGSAVAERLAAAGLGRRLVRLGLKDCYAHGASRPYLLREYGLDALALVRAVEELSGERLGIDPTALAAIDLPAPGRGAKAEDL